MTTVNIDIESWYAFLQELKENNNREWFQANKARYQQVKQEHEVFVGEMIRAIAGFDPQVKYLTPADCTYRIYRDIRFSSDKTPYKTHLGAYISRGGRKDPGAGYYIHIEPGHSLLSGGIWCPEAPLLKALRRDVYDNIEEFLKIVQYPDFARYYHLDGEKLKRVPAGYPADSPLGEWVKYKSYTVVNEVPDSFFTGKGAVAASADRLKLLIPFNRFLNYTIDESLNTNHTD